MANEKYHRYLASREWALLKKSVKERSNGVCERCCIQTAKQVHHLTYLRIYHESLDDLQHLCTQCHLFVSGVSDDDPRVYLHKGGTQITPIPVFFEINSSKYYDETGKEHHHLSVQRTHHEKNDLVVYVRPDEERSYL